MNRYKIMGNGKYTLGICAMQNKVENPQMKSILNRITATGEFTVIIFMQNMILNEDITTWPKVDCLISFYSLGFPLGKAISYSKLNNPVILNNLEKQLLMKSRVEIYNTLDKWKIPRPEFTVINHSETSEEMFKEESDFITYNGIKIIKPFIEKPIFSENHDNWIYYPENAGGGCKKLFRKIGDRSSEYDPNLWRVRRDGTYIYEEFLPTFGTDIKVYTVGPMFAHAEGRKSPCLDGKVQRTIEGKEVRYSVMLSYEEKLIAHRIVKAFDQTICGFDILRTRNGKSVVCDVNGWSFVKGNEKYYNDCAYIMKTMFLKKLCKRHKIIPKFNIFERNIIKESKGNFVKIDENEKKNMKNKELTHKDELSTVIVIMRHGSRKPKLKLKFETQDYRISSLLGSENEVLLKSPNELSSFFLINSVIIENLFMSLEDHSEEIAKNKVNSICSALNNFLKLRAFLGDGKRFSGVNRKVQLKRIPDSDSKVLVIAKWGGELTSMGCEQSEELGRQLRAYLYPGDSNGLLRLHSTFRHDFKIYSSDEGRCQVTSAAFTKGFLDLEGDLGPILVQLVIRDSFSRFLLNDSKVFKERKLCKDIIEKVLNINKIEINEHDIEKALSEYQCELDELKSSREIKDLLSVCNSPYTRLMKLYSLMEKLILTLNCKITNKNENDIIIYRGTRENIDSLFKVHSCDKEYGFPIKYQIIQRWSQLTNSFFNQETNRFVTCKVPDILDNSIYDLCYNTSNFNMEELKLLFDIYETILPIGEFVTRSQYGLTVDQKINIGKVVSINLLNKILADIKYLHTKNFDETKKQRDLNDVYRQFDKINKNGLHGKEKKKHKTKVDINENSLFKCKYQKWEREGNNNSTFGTSNDYPEEHIRLKEEEASAFGIKSPWRIVRSRFYVTSASHIQSLANIFSFLFTSDSNLSTKDSKNTEVFSEMNYLSHIVIRVWENKSVPVFEENRYRLEMFVCKGVKNNIDQNQDKLKKYIHKDNSDSEDHTVNCSVFIKKQKGLFPLKKVNIGGREDISISEFEERINKVIKS